MSNNNLFRVMSIVLCPNLLQLCLVKGNQAYVPDTTVHNDDVWVRWLTKISNDVTLGKQPTGDILITCGSSAVECFRSGIWKHFNEYIKSCGRRGEVACVGSQWHRDNQYSYTMYLTSLHNTHTCLDRSANKGVFTSLQMNWQMCL